MKNHSELLEAISRSKMFRDYERAFNEATGLPLALRPLEAWQPPFRGKPRENEFCAMMARQSESCAACLRTQEALAGAAANGPATQRCHFGLMEAAAPIKLGEQIIGYLATGQVLPQAPGPAETTAMGKMLAKLGSKVDSETARKAFLTVRVMSRNQLLSFARILGYFAENLSRHCNTLTIRQANAEPIAVVRAKTYIQEHLQDAIALADVAKAACTSTFYICKLFKRHTGLNFTEYVGRLRVERAKELLANPNLRVSEIAFDVGFQSLTHFNRLFHTITGESPTSYRHKLPLPLAA
jgi:AraC-like DNA-binding protein